MRAGPSHAHCPPPALLPGARSCFSPVPRLSAKSEVTVPIAGPLARPPWFPPAGWVLPPHSVPNSPGISHSSLQRASETRLHTRQRATCVSDRVRATPSSPGPGDYLSVDGGKEMFFSEWMNGWMHDGTLLFLPCLSWSLGPFKYLKEARADPWGCRSQQTPMLAFLSIICKRPLHEHRWGRLLSGPLDITYSKWLAGS